MYENFEELEGLNAQERELALKLLSDISDGNISNYHNLLYEDYDEIPVTIEEFIHNRKYLGNGLINSEGKFTIFPYWEEKLKEIL